MTSTAPRGAIALSSPFAWSEGVTPFEKRLELLDPSGRVPVAEIVKSRMADPYNGVFACTGSAECVWAMRNDAELASALFQQAIQMMRTERPPKQKLDSDDWRLLDSLVTDDATKSKLKPYFAVLETLWG